MASQGLPHLLAMASRDSGRSKTSAEIRDLICRMSAANSLWGAPRIHGELLKLGVDISQATVGRYLPRHPRTPSPTWRSFPHNHLADTAAIDIFNVATATFRILYTLIVLTMTGAPPRGMGPGPAEIAQCPHQTAPLHPHHCEDCLAIEDRAGEWRNDRK